MVYVVGREGLFVLHYDLQYGVGLDDVPRILLRSRIYFFVSMEFLLCSSVCFLTLEVYSW